MARDWKAGRNDLGCFVGIRLPGGAIESPNASLYHLCRRNWLSTVGGRNDSIGVCNLNHRFPTNLYHLRTKNIGHVGLSVGAVRRQAQ